MTIENNCLQESHKASSLRIYGIDDLGSSAWELAFNWREDAPSRWQLLSYSWIISPTRREGKESAVEALGLRVKERVPRFWIDRELSRWIDTERALGYVRLAQSILSAIGQEHAGQ